MANIFTLENVADFSEKLNLDELYEKKRQYDLNKLELYNKILNRIHVRIKTTSKKKLDEQFCWFVVPEIIIGVPKYDQGSCIAYLLDKLKENGFNVRYMHPNTLFICWNHWVPGYVRSELKKKTGIVVDEFGRKVNDAEENNNLTITTSRDNIEPVDLNEAMFKPRDTAKISIKPQKNFTPIRSYKPSGNLIYNDDLLNTLEDKLNG
jgi:hypothetical protein